MVPGFLVACLAPSPTTCSVLLSIWLSSQAWARLVGCSVCVVDELLDIPDRLYHTLRGSKTGKVAPQTQARQAAKALKGAAAWRHDTLEPNLNCCPTTIGTDRRFVAMFLLLYPQYPTYNSRIYAGLGRCACGGIEESHFVLRK
jgi:hypothetical protein